MEEPVHELRAPDAQGVFQTLVRAGGVAIERDGEGEYPESWHGGVSGRGIPGERQRPRDGCPIGWHGSELDPEAVGGGANVPDECLPDIRSTGSQRAGAAAGHSRSVRRVSSGTKIA
jgi:hypothetical protein